MENMNLSKSGFNVKHGLPQPTWAITFQGYTKDQGNPRLDISNHMEIGNTVKEFLL